MDTSETYIEMCEKAEEIQKKWKPTNESLGDFVVKKNIYYNTYEVGVLESHQSGYPMMSNSHGASGFDRGGDSFHKGFWLPRQDELQEMVGGFDAGMVNWGEWVNNVYPCMINPFAQHFASFEQLWLAFVMKERYGKTWDGRDWVIWVIA